MNEVIILFRPDDLPLLDTNKRFDISGCVNVPFAVCEKPYDFVKLKAKIDHHVVVAEMQNQKKCLAAPLAELIASISFPELDTIEPLSFEFFQRIEIPDEVYEECRSLPGYRKHFIPRKSEIIPSVRCFHRQFFLPRKIIES